MWVGADKVWSALVTLLARRTEKWWGSVMDVGLDPELTKWSVRSGPAIVLTGKGYKERHWLVVPPSTTPVISSSITTTAFTQICRCPLVLFPELKISTVGAEPPLGFGVKPGTAPTKEGLSPPLCSTRKVTA